ncbi:outer membrane protein [Bartonella sp. F02]|uniref:outer membrane protein n=1 Tax=Bartonella sp. F02 TaxID=2967262 RepID=UPI0022A90B78|nr:outer membrane protein [Bartonella sp. F02]MCZ2328099.1 porin family protein [Bartonella sp. F02]
MNIKYLMTVSVFALITAPVAQAADVMTHYQPASGISPVVNIPNFSWSGFYIGGQAGGFSSKTDFSIPSGTPWFPLDKELFPKPSGFVGGLYAGSNIDLGDSFIVSVDADVNWSGRKDTKTIIAERVAEAGAGRAVGRSDAARNGSVGAHPAPAGGSSERPYPDLALDGCAVDNNGPDGCNAIRFSMMSRDIGRGGENVLGAVKHTLKEKWSGATRIRFGFTADRFMPYVAGGVAYTQLQDTVSVDPLRTEEGVDISDETKTLVGYTLGGGLDFAVNDNIMLRAEYRYSDFGKKKFIDDKVQLSYKTNDFRVGVAYKF